ncbi:MAG: transglycosylase domain-containing protein, partial [Cereibacter sp.]
MSVTDNRRPVLVADKRYVAARKAAAGSGGGSRKTPAAKAKSAPRRPAPKRNPITGFFGGILRWMLRMIWGIGWRVAFLLAIVVGSVTLYFYQKLPDVTALLDARARGSVTLLDRNGKVFAWRGETFGGQIDAASVSPNLRNAIIATEDRRFYWHAGVSPRGILSAIRINLREGRGPLEGNGGSTITQQVAKLLCLGVPYDPTRWKSEAEYESDCRKGGFGRKRREMPFACALAAQYT